MCYRKERTFWLIPLTRHFSTKTELARNAVWVPNQQIINGTVNDLDLLYQLLPVPRHAARLTDSSPRCMASGTRTGSAGRGWRPRARRRPRTRRPTGTTWRLRTPTLSPLRTCQRPCLRPHHIEPWNTRLHFVHRATDGPPAPPSSSHVMLPTMITGSLGIISLLTIWVINSYYDPLGGQVYLEALTIGSTLACIFLFFIFPWFRYFRCRRFLGVLLCYIGTYRDFI